MSARDLVRTMGVTALEADVLQKLMEAHPDHAALIQAQLALATVTSRRKTPSGFFLNLAVSPQVLFEPANFELNDVYADIEGLEHGAGFVLFVRNGRLSFLEGHSHDEDWPGHVGDYDVFVRSPSRGVVH